MIDWSMPYSSTWRVFLVDEKTWADGDRVYGMTSASINREADGNLIESGTFTVDLPYNEVPGEGYYRIVMTAHQNGRAERVDIATLKCVSAGSTFDKGRNLQSLKGSSVLYPASTQKIALGGYAPSGVNGAAYAAELLSDCIKAPVSYAGSFILDSSVVFQQSWSILDCVWAVLDAGGFVIFIDGRGRVTISAIPYEPALVLDNANARLLGTKFSGDCDWSVVHNRYYAIEGKNVAVAVNDNPNSITSTTYRGYYNDIVDRSPKRVNGETLDAYAERKLREDSVILDSRNYTREWCDGVLPNRLVLGSIPSVGLSGPMRVTSQKLTLGNGVYVEETAGLEVSSWVE